MQQYQKQLIEIIANKTSWSEVKIGLSEYNVHSLGVKDTRAGKIFEVFAKYYFLLSPTEQGSFKNAWLFDEVPTEIKHKLNLGNQDYGVDLILEDIDNQLFVVQCKFKNDETSKLNWSADKIANLFAFCPNADGYIVFSNVADIDNISKTRHEKFTFYSISNLLEIETDTFINIYNDLTSHKLAEKVFFLPKKHQEEAIQDCVDFFEIESRGQLILPCGAGKTLTALWIKERLVVKNTLVLVPSLALLRQIKNDWKKQRKTNFKYLCVCSESDIDSDNIDTVLTHTYEIDVHVTTNANEIKQFLFKDDTEKVIFSTYHSLSAIEKAIEKTNFEFDFIFCDEAHKTAGIGMNKFSLVHDNTKIPSKRRLYATATPRIVKESIKKKLGDDLKYAYDMNDPSVFGEEFYRMTFKKAIEEGILVDYKIIAIGVNSEELKQFIDQRRYVESKASADEVANNYALERVMTNYNANHALTFHSRVKYAEDFSHRHKKVFKHVHAFSVSGEQSTNHRNRVLNDFKNSDKAIVSNARCLTEGVDVPVIDLVYFCDPKNSKVDIVQAVGRALRKKEGKKIGLVVVPIYHTEKENVEESISESSFKNLIQVIRSLCDQDERLQEEINLLAFGKGERQSKRLDIISANFTEKQDIVLLEGFEDKLRKSLFDQIVDKTSNNWDIWFMELRVFLDENDKTYPTEKNNSELHSWVAQMRNRKKNGTLKNDEIRKLNQIDFIWDMHEWKWNDMYSKLVEYAENNDFEPDKENNSELYSWYGTQKNHIKQQILRTDRADKIKKIIFNQAASKNKWESSYDKLVEFRKDNPDKWPAYIRKDKNSEQTKLSVFCQTIRQRYRENTLENYWFDKMSDIDFNFEGKSDNWLESYSKIKDLLGEKKSVSPNEIGNNAYSWIIRHKKEFEEGKLDENKTKLIEELKLYRFFETWEQTLDKVRMWSVQNGKLPTKVSNKELYIWLMSQRTVYKKGNLNNTQIQLIKSIGFDLEGLGLEANEQKWLEQFNEYKKFITENNREPSLVNENKLYVWAQTQRALKAGTLRNRLDISKEREDLLNSINFSWIGLGQRSEKTWDENFDDLLKYIDNGILKIPLKIDEVQNPLYTWFNNQKIANKNGKLENDQIEKYRNHGIDLSINERQNKKTWDENFVDLLKYLDNGVLKIPIKTEGEPNLLYGWFNNQKYAYKVGKMSQERIKKFKNVGIDLSIVEKNYEE